MLRIFGDFADQKTHDYPTKKQQNATKGVYCCFSTKKNNFVSRIFLQFSFFTTNVLSSSHFQVKSSDKNFFKQGLAALMT